MENFYDTHAHLDFPDFAAELEPVIQRAEAAGITRIITIGTDLSSSTRAVQLSEEFSNVFACVGWHPNDASAAPADFAAALRDLARHPKVVAIGETGLDYYRLPSSTGGSAGADEECKRRQREVFREQLDVAAGCGLNCVVHTRGDCFEAALACIEAFAGRVRCVFHCFVGTPEEMRRVLATGGLVSFTGIATFKGAGEVRATLAATPLESFLLETDAPFLAPVPHRGRRCEPAYVRDLAAVVAAVKGVTLAELSERTCATAHSFFPRLR